MSTATDSVELTEAEEEEEVMKLEEEVRQIAQRILDYRTTLPDQLISTFTSLVASQRTASPIISVEKRGARVLAAPESEPGSSRGSMGENGTSLENDNLEEAERIQLLKQKISSNTSTLPVVLNRMKECLKRIDTLSSSSENIPPAFKRKRTS